MAVVTHEQRASAILRVVADAVAAVPLEDVQLHDEHVSERVIDPMFTAADQLVRVREPLTYQKLQGARALDDVNEITVALGQALFQLGVAYGRRHLTGGTR